MASKLPPLRLAILTDQGMRRTMNEDRVAEITFGDSPAWGRGVLVADGMGGTAGGERASRIVAEDFAKRLKDWQVQPERLGDRLEGALTRHLMELTDGVHRRIRAEAATDPGLEGMGSTLTMLVIIGGQWCCVHVGDSCAYILRGRRLSRLTTDHAAEGSGALLQHMGGEREVDPQVIVGQLAPGDVFLVCTDGLTKHLEDGDIAHILGAARSPAEAAERLVTEANRRGGKDNISVGIIMPPPIAPIATGRRGAGLERRRKVLIPLLLLSVVVLVGAAAAFSRALNDQVSGGGGGGTDAVSVPQARRLPPSRERDSSKVDNLKSREGDTREEPRRDDRVKADPKSDTPPGTSPKPASSSSVSRAPTPVPLVVQQPAPRVQLELPTETPKAVKPDTVVPSAKTGASVESGKGEADMPPPAALRPVIPPPGTVQPVPTRGEVKVEGAECKGLRNRVGELTDSLTTLKNNKQTAASEKVERMLEAVNTEIRTKRC